MTAQLISDEIWETPLHALAWPHPNDLHPLEISDLISTENIEVPHYPLAEKWLHEEDVPYQQVLNLEVKTSSKRTAKYLDLTKAANYNANSPRALLPCRETRILLIKDYETAYNLLVAEDDEIVQLGVTGRAFAIVGNPGVGKTYFLSFVLLMRLLKGLITIWVRADGKTSLFTSKGVRVFPNLESVSFIVNTWDAATKAGVWCLLDSHSPEAEHRYWGINFVQVTSPKQQAYKGWLKQHMGTLIRVDLWTWEEIVALSKLNPTAILIQYWMIFVRYGGVPRQIVSHTTRPTQFLTKVREYDQELRAIIERWVSNKADPDMTKLSVNETHVLIASRPMLMSGQNPDNHLLTAYIDVIVANRIAVHLRRKTLTSLASLLATPVTRSAAKRVFEAMQHDLVAVRIFHKCFDARGLRSLEPNNHISRRKSALSEIKVMSQIRKFDSIDDIKSFVSVPAKTTVAPHVSEIYFQPLSKTFPSVDSFYLSKNLLQRHTLVMKQITVGRSHPIETEGLAKVCNSMPYQATRYGSYLVFVLPEEDALGFTKQPYQDYGVGGGMNWDEEIHQMVVGIDMAKLFQYWSGLKTIPSAVRMDMLEEEKDLAMEDVS